MPGSSSRRSSEVRPSEKPSLETLGHPKERPNGANLKYKTLIGQGGFSTIFQAYDESLQRGVAVKYTEDVDTAVDEIYILRDLDNNNVIELYYYFYDSSMDSFTMVLQLFTCDLATYREKNSEKKGVDMDFKAFAFQAFKGLDYLASKRIMHRDIKSGNLLVNPATGILAIADFGLAKKENKVPHSSPVGTPGYIAPEVLLGAEEYDHSVDTWSAAVVLTELVAGGYLFWEYGDSLSRQFGKIANLIGAPTKNEVAAMRVDERGPIIAFYRPLGDAPQREEATLLKMQQKLRRLMDANERSGLRRSPLDSEDRIALRELAGHILRYDPGKRWTAIEACGHRFFDSIKRDNAVMSNGLKIAPILN